MDRASSLLQNASEPKHSSKRAQRKQRKEDPESLEWSEEEIYLASLDYDRYMDTNVKRELRGVDAREHLDFLQKAKSREAAGQCQIMGLGHCSTPFYTSSSWELASSSDGTKGFDTTEYQGWVRAAWAKCLAKDRAWDLWFFTCSWPLAFHTHTQRFSETGCSHALHLVDVSPAF